MQPIFQLFFKLQVYSHFGSGKIAFENKIGIKYLLFIDIKCKVNYTKYAMLTLH